MGKKGRNQARNKKSNDKYFGNTDVDDLSKQLKRIGLMVKEMVGDGNCLFRALGDQLEGHSRNHIDLRLKVVNYIKANRDSFEPFIEDDVSFEDHVQSLSEPGTYGGNDAIVAFSRLFDVCVVIHQQECPAWVIYPKSLQEKTPGMKELHISYHNGDHYNSVVKLPQTASNPDVSGNKGAISKAQASSPICILDNVKQDLEPSKPSNVKGKIRGSESTTKIPENKTGANSETTKGAGSQGKPVKMSRRQVLELKKKERKADALQRKRGSAGDSLANDLSRISLKDVPAVKTLTI